jgi:predicted nucleic acid-binding protein
VILVDTSIWVDHFRSFDDRLAYLLNSKRVFVHPYVLGELALGNFKRRDLLLNELQHLPQATVATDREVLLLIDRLEIFGQGIGYVDAHLVAAVRLTIGSTLWTRDRRLGGICRRFGLAFDFAL